MSVLKRYRIKEDGLNHNNNMTHTQWLAIPTEIRLTELSPRVNAFKSDSRDPLNVEGNNFTVKEEDGTAPETQEITEAPSVYLCPLDEESRLRLENHTSLANFIVVTSAKRNTDYRVQEFTVATRRSRPVNFRLLRVKLGVQLSISLTYQGHIYGEEPVKRCKKHDECTWCKGHEFNEAFCVISKFHRVELDHRGHPTAVVTPKADHLDIDNSVEFSVVFACWNSCDVHLRFGKEMTLHIQIMQDGDVKTVEYKIHCCQNLRRDAFKDRKRKLASNSEKSQENPSKASSKSFDTALSSPKSSLKASPNASEASSSCPSSSPPASPTSVKERAVDIVVEGLDEEKRDLIERLVKTIGGNTYRIPHLLRMKQQEALERRNSSTK